MQQTQTEAFESKEIENLQSNKIKRDSRRAGDTKRKPEVTQALSNIDRNGDSVAKQTK